MDFIARQSCGDVRYALNLTELAVTLAKDQTVTLELLKSIPSVHSQRSFKGDDGHYDLVSAFQKSIRGSDVDAALYYLALLIESGDMDSIERRLEYMPAVEKTPTNWAKDGVLKDQILQALDVTEDQADLVFTVSVQGHGKYPMEPAW